MTGFPDELPAGSDEHATTYTLARNHYLVRATDDSFSADETFESLVPDELPDYIEAARPTLEPAALRWVETRDDVAADVAESAFADSDGVDEVLPVYFQQGGGVESAATPLFHTINVELDAAAGETATHEAIEALGPVHDPVASELLDPIRVYRLDEDVAVDEAARILEQIGALNGVGTAEFDWLKLETYSAIPSDAFYNNQWGARAIDLANALHLATGSPAVTIAIVDSGFDLGHPDLAFSPPPTHFNAIQALAGGRPPYDASSSGVNHGTAVAGIAGARTNNSVGVAGIGGGCRIMPVRLGTVPSSNRVAAGINWAARNGARVACMSLGTGVTTAATTAMTNAWGAGMVLCAATGNGGGNTTSPAVNFPANHRNVIAVGASDQNAQRKRPASADGERWGSQFDANTDVVAPGVRIWTTDEQGANGYTRNGGPATVAGVNYPSSGDSTGDYYALFNGTSAATPHVAGLAGLLFSAAPGSTNQEVRDAIEQSCTKINPGLYRYATVAGRTNGTWHQEVGHGQIDAHRALEVILGRARRVEFREGWINFPATSGRRQRQLATVDFRAPIITQHAMLKGFNIRYRNGDRRVLETEIDLDSSTSGTQASVWGDFVIRDDSGTYDDPYEGWINFVVMAELA